MQSWLGPVRPFSPLAALHLLWPSSRLLRKFTFFRWWYPRLVESGGNLSRSHPEPFTILGIQCSIFVEPNHYDGFLCSRLQVEGDEHRSRGAWVLRGKILRLILLKSFLYGPPQFVLFRFVMTMPRWWRFFCVGTEVNYSGQVRR